MKWKSQFAPHRAKHSTVMAADLGSIEESNEIHQKDGQASASSSLTERRSLSLASSRSEESAKPKCTSEAPQPWNRRGQSFRAKASP